MEFLAFIYAVAAFFIFVAVLSGRGEAQDALVRRVKFISGKGNKQEMVDELNSTFFDRFISPVIKNIQETIAKLTSKENSVGKKKESIQETEKKLRLAGMDISVEAYTFYRQCFMAIVIIVALFLALAMDVGGMVKLLIIAIGAAIAIAGPTLFLSVSASTRQEAIRLQLPDALDLLGVCIEAGLSFDNSLLKVSEKIEGPFIDELLVVYREIQMGVPRNDALRKLSDGSEIPELKTFISALIQANQLGIPINNVMDVQSKQLRQTRSQQAREKGAKAPVKMLIPMIIFIFPVIFIILMGPTVLDIMELMG